MVDIETESYKEGDLLKKTPFYESTFPNWKSTDGIVVSAKKASVYDIALGKDERPLYRARYGAQKVYPSFDILIRIEEIEYRVSQLGFNREGV